MSSSPEAPAALAPPPPRAFSRKARGWRLSIAMRMLCDRIRQDLPGITGTFLADVADHAQVQQAFGNVIVALGGLDVVINNAGISIRHKFLDITPEEWSRVLAVNLTGVF